MHRTTYRIAVLITQYYIRHQVIVSRFLAEFYFETAYLAISSLYRSKRQTVNADTQLSVFGRGSQCVAIATLCIKNGRTIHITQHVVQGHQYLQCRHLVSVGQVYRNLHLITRMSLS